MRLNPNIIDLNHSTKPPNYAWIDKKQQGGKGSNDVRMGVHSQHHTEPRLRSVI